MDKHYYTLAFRSKITGFLEQLCFISKVKTLTYCCEKWENVSYVFKVEVSFYRKRLHYVTIYSTICVNYLLLHNKCP